MKVYYHPVFLYFNEYVRLCELYPDKNKSVWWTGNSEFLSLYDTFNFILKNIRIPAHHEKIPLFLKETSPNFPLSKVSKKVDMKQWLFYARSLGFEKMLKDYSNVVFQCFGTTFELPDVIISPVRANPCNDKKLYERFLFESYNYDDVLTIDIPYYDPNRHFIYIPVPETPIKTPPYSYDFTLLHEIFHAPFRFLYGFVFEDTNYQYSLPDKEALKHFSQFLSDAGAMYVLNTKKVVRKKDIESFYQRFYHGVHREVMVAVFRIFWKVGFVRLCHIFSPVFSIVKKLSFLLAEREKIDKMTPKKLRGILVKKYDYTSKVKGMDKKKLKEEVHKRFLGRMKTLAKEIEAIDLYKLLNQEIEREKDEAKKKDMIVLKQLFTKKMNVHWRELLWNKENKKK